MLAGFAVAGEGAMIGMGAVAGAVMGAPISTILIIFELTADYELTTAVMIATITTAATHSCLPNGSTASAVSTDCRQLLQRRPELCNLLRLKPNLRQIVFVRHKERHVLDRLHVLSTERILALRRTVHCKPLRDAHRQVHSATQCRLVRHSHHRSI